MPASYRDTLPVALGLARAMTAPASPQEATVAVGLLVDWICDFGVVTLPAADSARQAWLDRIVSGYLDALDGLPGDLLVAAVRRTTREHRMSMLPLPGEVRARAEADLSARRALVQRLTMAVSLGRFETPPVAAADRVTPAQMAQVRRAIGGVGR